MTNEEFERAIEHILNLQANFEVQLEKTNQQLAETDAQVKRTSRQIEETNKRLDIYAETQTEFIKIVTKHIEAQGEINASLRASLARTDSRLDALIDIVRDRLSGQS
jgi:DNA polymerase elongation subunit (family B)